MKGSRIPGEAMVIPGVREKTLNRRHLSQIPVGPDDREKAIYRIDLSKTGLSTPPPPPNGARMQPQEVSFSDR
jgi:hypothetical protein